MFTTTTLLLRQKSLMMTSPAKSPPKRPLLLMMDMKRRSPLQRLLLRMLLRRSPLQRLLMLSRNVLSRVLQQPNRPRLRSPQMLRVVLHLLRLLLKMGLGRLSQRYPSRGPRGQAAPPLNSKKLRSKLLLPGKGSCARRALQRLLCLYLSHTKGSRPLLQRRLTPTSQACPCHPLILKLPWTLRQMLGTTLSFILTNMTPAFPFNDI